MEFTEKQKQIIDKTAGALIVLAPAGSGKTLTMSYKAKKLLESGYKEEEICVLTFSRQAKANMLKSIASTLNTHENRVKMNISTIHSLAYSAIRQNYEILGLRPNLEVLDADYLYMILDEIIEKNYPKLPTKESLIKALDKTIQEYKSNYLNKTKSLVDIFRSHYKLESPVVDVKTLVMEYRKICLNEGLLDFNDLMIQFHRLLHTPEGKLFMSKWKYYMIDEIQDLSVEDFKLLVPFLNKNFTLLGDTNQTIYEWRGSNPLTIIKHLKDKMGDELSIVTLDITHRTPKTILDFVNKNLMQYTSSIVLKEIESTNNINSIPVVKGYKTFSSEIENVCSQIKRLTDKSPSMSWNNDESKSYDLKDIVITARDNYKIKTITDYLNSINMPYITNDESLFSDKTQIIRSIINMISRNDLGYSLKKFAFELFDSESVKDLNNLLKIEGLDYQDLYDLNTDKPVLKESLFLDYLKKDNVCVIDFETTGVSPYLDDIIEVGIAKIDKDFNIVDKYQTLIKTDKKFDGPQIHGYTEEDINERGIPKEQALEEILNFINGSLLVAHNADFDITILKRELFKSKKYQDNFKNVIPNIKYIDTYKLALKYFPQLPNFKLSTIQEYFGFKNKPTHQAMDDVITTVDFLHVLSDRIGDTFVEPHSHYFECLEKYSIFFDLNERIEMLKYSSKEIKSSEIIEDIFDFLGWSLDMNKDSRKVLDIVKELEQTHKPIESIEVLCNFKDKAKDYFKNIDCIRVFNIHQLKGLEFKVVFFVAVNDGVIPSWRSVNNKNISEEVRLFYVACTRPTEKLFISYHTFDRGKVISKSKLLNYIPES